MAGKKQNGCCKKGKFRYHYASCVKSGNTVIFKVTCVYWIQLCHLQIFCFNSPAQISGYKMVGENSICCVQHVVTILINTC